jgi:predicted peroxiredoxin
MAKILAVATHATDDPTKCTLAFITAVGALGAGKEVTIGLVGEAVCPVTVLAHEFLHR